MSSRHSEYQKSVAEMTVQRSLADELQQYEENDNLSDSSFDKAFDNPVHGQYNEQYDEEYDRAYGQQYDEDYDQQYGEDYVEQYSSHYENARDNSSDDEAALAGWGIEPALRKNSTLKPSFLTDETLDPENNQLDKHDQHNELEAEPEDQIPANIPQTPVHLSQPSPKPVRAPSQPLQTSANQPPKKSRHRSTRSQTSFHPLVLGASLSHRSFPYKTHSHNRHCDHNHCHSRHNSSFSTLLDTFRNGFSRRPLVEENMLFLERFRHLLVTNRLFDSQSHTLGTSNNNGNNSTTSKKPTTNPASLYNLLTGFGIACKNNILSLPKSIKKEQQFWKPGSSSAAVVILLVAVWAAVSTKSDSFKQALVNSKASAHQKHSTPTFSSSSSLSSTHAPKALIPPSTNQDSPKPLSHAPPFDLATFLKSVLSAIKAVLSQNAGASQISASAAVATGLFDTTSTIVNDTPNTQINTTIDTINTATKSIAILLLAFSFPILIFAYSRRRAIRLLRIRVLNSTSHLIDSTKPFDSAVYKCLSVIKEIDLLSRGYRPDLVPHTKTSDHSSTTNPSSEKFRHAIPAFILQFHQQYTKQHASTTTATSSDPKHNTPYPTSASTSLRVMGKHLRATLSAGLYLTSCQIIDAINTVMPYCNTLDLDKYLEIYDMDMSVLQDFGWDYCSAAEKNMQEHNSDKHSFGNPNSGKQNFDEQRSYDNKYNDPIRPSMYLQSLSFNIPKTEFFGYRAATNSLPQLKLEVQKVQFLRRVLVCCLLSVPLELPTITTPDFVSGSGSGDSAVNENASGNGSASKSGKRPLFMSLLNKTGVNTRLHKQSNSGNQTLLEQELPQPTSSPSGSKNFGIGASQNPLDSNWELHMWSTISTSIEQVSELMSHLSKTLSLTKVSESCGLVVPAPQSANNNNSQSIKINNSDNQTSAQPLLKSDADLELWQRQMRSLNNIFASLQHIEARMEMVRDDGIGILLSSHQQRPERDDVQGEGKRKGEKSDGEKFGLLADSIDQMYEQNEQGMDNVELKEAKSIYGFDAVPSSNVSTEETKQEQMNDEQQTKDDDDDTNDSNSNNFHAFEQVQAQFENNFALVGSEINNLLESWERGRAEFHKTVEILKARHRQGNDIKDGRGEAQSGNGEKRYASSASHDERSCDLAATQHNGLVNSFSATAVNQDDSTVPSSQGYSMISQSLLASTQPEVLRYNGNDKNPGGNGQEDEDEDEDDDAECGLPMIPSEHLSDIQKAALEAVAIGKARVARQFKKPVSKDLSEPVSDSSSTTTKATASLAPLSSPSRDNHISHSPFSPLSSTSASAIAPPSLPQPPSYTSYRPNPDREQGPGFHSLHKREISELSSVSAATEMSTAYSLYSSLSAATTLTSASAMGSSASEVLGSVSVLSSPTATTASTATNTPSVAGSLLSPLSPVSTTFPSLSASALTSITNELKLGGSKPKLGNEPKYKGDLKATKFQKPKFDENDRMNFVSELNSVIQFNRNKKL